MCSIKSTIFFFFLARLWLSTGFNYLLSASLPGRCCFRLRGPICCFKTETLTLIPGLGILSCQYSCKHCLLICFYYLWCHWPFQTWVCSLHLESWYHTVPAPLRMPLPPGWPPWHQNLSDTCPQHVDWATPLAFPRGASSYLSSPVLQLLSHFYCLTVCLVLICHKWEMCKFCSYTIKVPNNPKWHNLSILITH